MLSLNNNKTTKYISCTQRAHLNSCTHSKQFVKSCKMAHRVQIFEQTSKYRVLLFFQKCSRFIHIITFTVPTNMQILAFGGCDADATNGDAEARNGPYTRCGCDIAASEDTTTHISFPKQTAAITVTTMMRNRQHRPLTTHCHYATTRAST